MIGLPEIGQRVRIWPAPGRQRIQSTPRPLDQMGGGRQLTVGTDVVWSAFHLEQLRAGDIILQDPAPAMPAAGSDL